MPKTIVNLDVQTYRKLKAQSLLEHRPMAEIIREAIDVQFKMKPLDKERFHSYLNEVLEEDAGAIKKLADL
jgi:hypothetical protein